jgi:hypothetical protein
MVGAARREAEEADLAQALVAAAVVAEDLVAAEHPGVGRSRIQVCGINAKVAFGVLGKGRSNAYCGFNVRPL